MKRSKPLYILLLVAILLFNFIGCAPKEPEKTPENSRQEQTKPADESKAPQNSNQTANNKENTSNKEDTGGGNNKNEAELKTLKANENGQVMILMYHGIGEKEAEWVRTPENFKKDLKALYDKGYRLISLKDYIENNIKVEAGFTPFVLTFDDGLQNSFNIIEENGQKKIDPNCAVGILEGFKKEHPDFGKGGSFFVYYPIPFRQKALIKEKYDFLINNGYDIGNHSYTHENLGELSIENVQKVLALNVKNTQQYLPGYDVYALALPFGAAPKGDNYKYVVQGEYEGVKYNNRAVLKVGSNPAPSPVDVKFNPLKLPRVRGSEMKTDGVGLYDWLSYFDKNPGKRYISDGDSATVAIPAKEEGQVDKSKLNGKKLVIYSDN